MIVCVLAGTVLTVVALVSATAASDGAGSVADSTSAGPASAPAPEPIAPDTPDPAAVGWAAALTGRLYCSTIDPDVFVQHQDYTGDGIPEAVVAYQCADSPSPSPTGEAYGQVEVFDGRSQPGALISLGMLVQTPPASSSPTDAMPLGMLVAEVHLEGPSIRVVGRTFPYGNPPCPTYEGTVTARWNGTDFTVGDRRDYVAFSC